MEIFVSYLSSDSTLLFKWQTLLGAFLGPFFAFLVGKAYGSWEERKQALRRIEASITRSLNESFTTRKLLRAFRQRLVELIQELRSEQNPNVYNLSIENFPPISPLTSDAELSGLKLSKSLYLHNKLLWIATGINNTNFWVQELRPNYQRLYALNQTLVDRGVAPARVRTIYAGNLENFLKAVDNLTNFTQQGIQVMTQVKIYNQKLVGPLRGLVVWFYEGVSFRYFRNKEELREYSVPLNITSRVDILLEQEVNNLISEANRREQEFAQQE